ncbi:chemotaxis protein CheR (plasmid) [Comamonadaceae bacterium OTU4NAUVB1]|nr:chemotaxis protein CheR [Comamonadaceae bacterium OTU4NAUVB1]
MNRSDHAHEVDAASEGGRAGQRDFVFKTGDFRRVQALIHAHAGIAIADTKEEMVYSRLSRRLRATNLSSVEAYLRHLETPGNEAEWEHFTNALTTNLTSFFREAHHFPILTQHLKALARDRPLRVWTCAASTGEEPYSIAMALAEAFDTLSPPVRILATDIDTKVLAIAQAGVYDDKRVAELPVAQVKRFFQRGSGAQVGKVRIRPELAALMRFKPLNLLTDEWLSLKPFDAIFCRNVMIYFDKPTQYAVLTKLVQLLESDGLFFAGHSESLLFASDLVRLRSHTVYERAPAGTPKPRQALPPRVSRSKVAA